MDAELSGLHNQFKNSYTRLLFQRYRQYSDFREVVDRLVELERQHKGHCNVVQDAAKLADLISYNHYVRRELKK